MVLLVTNRRDLTVDWLVVELERRGTPYLRFNTEDYPSSVRVVWTDDGDARLVIRDQELALGDVSAVWYRRPVPPRVAASDRALATWMSAEAEAALTGLWSTHDALWVNHPTRNRVAGSKPHQLRAARRRGLHVPATLVSNDPERLRAFADDQRAGVVCKPLTHGLVDGERQRVLWTSALGAEEIAALSDAGPEPYLVQELIPKACDVRVTVIGESVFAVRIASQTDPRTAVDWRRGDVAELDHTIAKLPGPTENACRALTRDYGLAFAAIDLALRPDGGYTFFELNPNGQWAWLQQLTGAPLSARLADLLETGR